MKKSLIVGMALALTALLMFSCNKNRFDFDELNSVEGSGQWKLPIGNIRMTLGDLMTQFGENEMVSYDADGNLQIAYQMELLQILRGSDFLNLGTVNFSTKDSIPNPFQGMTIYPIDTVFRFSQQIELSTDSVGIESAIVKSGEMMMTMVTNLGNVSEIVLSSSGITEATGDSLVRHFHELHGNKVDLAGATFNLHDPVTGVADSILTLNYAVYYQMTGIDDPQYEINTIIALNRIKFQQIRGYISGFVYSFDYDTAFSLPLNNIEGQATLVGADVKVFERNTFENLFAELRINQAEFGGGGLMPSPIFGHYPYVLQVRPSDEYVNVLPDETLDLTIDTRYDAVHVSADLAMNAGSTSRLIVINDYSTLDMLVDATIPMCFNIPGVHYLDTLDLSLPEIEAPDLVKEIVLTIDFDSEIPFNLNGQFYTLNSMTGHITDSLMTTPMHLNGSFDGSTVRTKAEITLTHDRIEHLLAADKLVMRFGVDTDSRDVRLNLDNGIGMTLKADVIYGGSVNVNE